VPDLISFLHFEFLECNFAYAGIVNLSIDIQALCKNLSSLFHKFSLIPRPLFLFVKSFPLQHTSGNCIASIHYQNEQIDPAWVKLRSNVERNNLTNGYWFGKVYDCIVSHIFIPSFWSKKKCKKRCFYAMVIQHVAIKAAIIVKSSKRYWVVKIKRKYGVFIVLYNEHACIHWEKMY